MKKINVGILFGGKSAEHEVSLQSARNVFDALDRNKYSPVLIGIDKNGRWLLADESRFLLDTGDPKKIRLHPTENQVVFAPEGRSIISGLASGMAANSREHSLDVVFPMLHGPFGEDGTVQGLLKLAGVPFVGSSVLASAAAMDKDVMKRLLRDAGLPISGFRTIKSHEKIPGFNEITGELGLPLFIKPANMGSSVGVSKVKEEKEYMAAINHAFSFDTKIILEEYINGRELECSVLGNEEPKASAVGEVISTHEFYSYDAKYIDEKGAALEIPARISDEAALKIKTLAIETFLALGCEGLGRVDFFMTNNNEIFINEINTIPGFTNISMYPKLWEAGGISYSQLIDILIDLALKRFDKEKKLKTSV